MLTVPEYYKKYIDPTVDLNITPKIPCPFHHEDKPSFSFKPDKDIWRCFGACKTGGDVYMLHKANFKLKTKEEAIASLHALEHVEYHPSFIEKKEYYANETDVSFGITYAKAISCIKSIDDCLELDYIMGQSPVSIMELENYCTLRGK